VRACSRIIFLAAALLGAGLPAWCLADSDLAVRVEPAPSSFEPVAIVIDAVSPDLCVPQLSSVNRTGSGIDIVLSEPLAPCAAVVTPWKVRAELGLLAPGSYSASVRLEHPPQIPPQPLGDIAFAVIDRLGGSLHGADLRRTVCRNRTTGQRVSVAGNASSANCEAAGLIVRDGDRIAIRLLGRMPRYEMCAGIAGLECSAGNCVDDPRDDCEPDISADCPGICVGAPPK